MKKKGWIIGGVLVLLAVGAAAVVYIRGVHYFQNHFFANTVINHIDCTNMTVDEALAELQKGVDTYQMEVYDRDGGLAVHVLRVLAERHLTLRQAAALLPKLCTVQRDVSTTLTRQAVEGLDNREKEPSVRLSLPPQGRLVRLRVHADTMEAAAELCTQWEKKLRSAEAKN